jgi:hypothetical protein
MDDWFDGVSIGRKGKLGIDCAGYILFAELLKVGYELKDGEIHRKGM